MTDTQRIDRIEAAVVAIAKTLEFRREIISLTKPTAFEEQTVYDALCAIAEQIEMDRRELKPLVGFAREK